MCDLIADHSTGATPMSDETHAPREQYSRAQGQLHTGAVRSFLRGVNSTVKFFAPSIIVGLVAPFVFPAMRRAAKPVAKGILKGALTFSESMKEGATQAREQMADLLVEVKAEREREAAESAAAKTTDT
jgi:hypothetical protein